MDEVRCIIVGAGVIGLASAYELCATCNDIVVIEKNTSFGQETSSRNSEVIHAGLYYPPQSLKAMTCIRGRDLLYRFCQKYGINHKKISKLVVATDSKEERRVKEIYENAERNGIKNLEFLSARDVRRIEPHISVRAAFLSPDSGIIDSHSFMAHLYREAKEKGVIFSFATEVVDITKKPSGYIVSVKDTGGRFFSLKSDIVINAAGLCAGKIAQMAGIDIKVCGYDLSYCKGQYFRISSPGKFKVRRLIYPPDTRLSLGIHITPDLTGGLRLGPDAKYIAKIDYNINEADKTIFCEAVKRFLPGLGEGDLIPDIAGIRPKLQKEDEDFRDFVVVEESEKGLLGFINCIGIESPGLTASLAIARKIKVFSL